MKLKKLVMRNFLSHENTELDLTEVTTCSIVGNNGAGKSTIMEAILWALFGHAKVPNKNLIRSGQSKMSVTVEFTLLGQDYTVHRSCKNGIVSAQGYVNGESLGSNVEGMTSKLTQIFGISRELLMESTVINQGNLSSFLTAYSSQRRDLIISALGLDRFSKAGDNARALYKSADADFRGHQSSFATLQTDLAEMPNDASMALKISEASKKLDEARVKTKKLTGQRDTLVAQNKDTRETLKKLNDETALVQQRMTDAAADFDEKIILARNNVSNADTQIATLEGLKQSSQRLEESFRQAVLLDERLKALRPQIVTYKKDVTTYKERLEIARRVSDTCPICQSQISSEAWKKIVDDLDTILQDLIIKHDQADREVKSIGSPAVPKTVSDQIDKVKASVVTIEGLQASRPVFEASISSFIEQKDARINELINQLKRMDVDIDAAKAKLNIELEGIERDLSIWELAEQQYLNELTNWTSRRAGRETLERSMERIQDQLNYYRGYLPEIEFVASALSPNGIPLMIIDKYIPEIESKSQSILNDISDGKLNLKLEVLEDGKKGVDILAGTNELRPIRSLSGGEQTRVGLAIRIALSQILFELANCRFYVLFIDEPEYLDQEGIFQFVSLVNSLRKYYQQIFVISHLEEMKTAFPSIISVVKQDDVSSASIEVR